MYTHMFL